MPVCFQNNFFVWKFFSISFQQGGYHELQNEPDGVAEKLLEEVVSFIDDHLTQPALASSAPEEVTTVQQADSNPAVTELARGSAKAKMWSIIRRRS